MFAVRIFNVAFIFQLKLVEFSSKLVSLNRKNVSNYTTIFLSSSKILNWNIFHSNWSGRTRRTTKRLNDVLHSSECDHHYRDLLLKTVAYGGPSSWVFTYCKKAYRTLGGKPPRPPSYPPTYVSIYGIPITYDQQLLISKMKIYLLRFLHISTWLNIFLWISTASIV